MKNLVDYFGCFALLIWIFSFEIIKMKKPSLIYQLNVDDYRENFILTKIKNFGDHIEATESVEFSKGDLINAFEEYGGSFVQSLWHCLSCADHINTQKIIKTFQDYVNEYAFEFIKSDKKNVKISKWSVEVKK